MARLADHRWQLGHRLGHLTCEMICAGTYAQCVGFEFLESNRDVGRVRGRYCLRACQSAPSQHSEMHAWRRWRPDHEQPRGREPLPTCLGSLPEPYPTKGFIATPLSPSCNMGTAATWWACSAKSSASPTY